MDFHNYVNKEITLVRSNDIMMYARGKHTQFKHWFKATGLLAVLNSHIIVQMSVFWLESIRGPRKDGDGEKYFYVKNSQEVEQISEHS